jgi:hypothetical protein
MVTSASAASKAAFNLLIRLKNMRAMFIAPASPKNPTIGFLDQSIGARSIDIAFDYASANAGTH